MPQTYLRPRVVVTGLGMITPLGLNADDTWAGLMKARSAAAPITRFDASEFAVRFACEVHGFDATSVMDYREARRFDRLVQFAMVAAKQATDQAGLVIHPDEAHRAGVVIGCGLGGMETLAQGFEALTTRGPMRVNPLTGAMVLPNMPAGKVAMTYGAMGPNFAIASACATGANSIGEAAEIIRRGDADIMLAGSSDANLTPLGLSAFHRVGAMSTRNDDPKRASRPFDKMRDGFVVAEGCGILVLEAEEHARKRGAAILAEFAGYGASSDAFHVSAPLEDGAGAALAMSSAISKAGLEPGDIDHINAHGTGTPLNDLSETRAIKGVFGEHAYDIPISATKSMHGHVMAGAGAIEAGISVLTILRGVFPPTINQEVPDPECDLDYVPNEPRTADRPINSVLSNSFGFGGHNGSLLFRRYEPHD